MHVVTFKKGALRWGFVDGAASLPGASLTITLAKSIVPFAVLFLSNLQCVNDKTRYAVTLIRLSMIAAVGSLRLDRGGKAHIL